MSCISIVPIGSRAICADGSADVLIGRRGWAESTFAIYRGEEVDPADRLLSVSAADGALVIGPGRSPRTRVSGALRLKPNVGVTLVGGEYRRDAKVSADGTLRLAGAAGVAITSPGTSVLAGETVGIAAADLTTIAGKTVGISASGRTTLAGRSVLVTPRGDSIERDTVEYGPLREGAVHIRGGLIRLDDPVTIARSAELTLRNHQHDYPALLIMDGLFRNPEAQGRLEEKKWFLWVDSDAHLRLSSAQPSLGDELHGWKFVGIPVTP